MPAPTKTRDIKDDLLTLSERCICNERKDGSLIVAFRIDPDVAKRLKSRANGMDMDRYLWEQILHRSLETAVF